MLRITIPGVVFAIACNTGTVILSEWGVLPHRSIVILATLALNAFFFSWYTAVVQFMAYLAFWPFLHNRGPLPDINQMEGWYEIALYISLNLLVILAVTLLRENQRRAYAAEGLYQQIVEAATEGIWILDRYGKTAFVNQQVANMLGWTQKEIIGHTLLDYLDPSEQEEGKRYLAEVSKGKAPPQDFALRRKDGEVMWAILSAVPLRRGAWRHTCA